MMIDCPQCLGAGYEIIERTRGGYHNFSPYVDHYDSQEDCRLCGGIGQVEKPDNAEDRLYYWKIRKGIEIKE
jgi:hypothetical protein